MNVDQVLAAEPGFHRDPPQGGGSGMISVHLFSDHCSELVEQQPENGLALAFGPAEPLGVVVKDGAGGAAFEAASRLMIQFLSREFGGQGDAIRALPLAQRERGFEVADAFFHAAVVAGIMGRVIQRQHAEAGQHVIHRVMIKRRTIVAFEEQRCAVLAEEAFQMGRDLVAPEPVGDQRPEAIAGGEVLEGDDVMAHDPIFGRVAGPGQPGPKPVNAFHGGKLILPIILHQPGERAPGEGGGEPQVKCPGALRADAAVVQLPQEQIKLGPVQQR